MEHVVKLDAWFADKLGTLNCREDTRAYVSGVLSKFHPNKDSLTNDSIVLAFNDAKLCGDFVAFQRIGDYVLWADSVFPEHTAKNKELVVLLGRLSYYRCHHIMKKQWLVFEELADDLPRIILDIRSQIYSR